MSTLLELRTDLRDRLSEASARQWPDASLNRYINEGARDLSRRTECLRDTANIAVVIGTQTYTGPTNLIRLHRIELITADSNIALEYRDYSSMDSVWHSAQSSRDGHPVYYTTWGMPPLFKIILYPTPSAVGTLKVFYYRFPANVTVDATAVEVPEGWQDLVVLFAESTALRRDADPRWQEAKAEYMERLGDLYTTALRYGDQAGTIDGGWSSGGLPEWLTQDAW